MTLKEFFKKAGQLVAMFLSGVVAVLLFIAGRRSVSKKTEEDAEKASVGRENIDESFEKDAESVRENTKDVIAGMSGRDVADMYPTVWDSIAESREQYLRRAGEALDRKRGDGTGG